MRKLLVLYIFSIFFFASCNIRHGKGGIAEGEMIYSITYLVDEKEKPIVGLMPPDLKMQFKDNSVKLNVEGWMGVFKSSFIKDAKENTPVTLLRMLNKKMCYKGEQGEKFLGFSDYKNINIAFDDKTKDILNFKCKHAKITINDTQESFDVYYTEDINIENPNEFTPYEKIPGVLLDFQVEINGIPMHLNATKIIHTVVSDDVFNVPPNYKMVTKKDMEKIFKSII